MSGSHPKSLSPRHNPSLMNQADSAVNRPSFNSTDNHYFFKGLTKKNNPKKNTKKSSFLFTQKIVQAAKQ